MKEKGDGVRNILREKTGNKLHCKAEDEGNVNQNGKNRER